MGLKNTVDWARTEWGIFRKGGEMGWGQRGRWLGQWVPFGARTVGWATLSLTTGPLTKGKASTWAAKKWSQSSAKGLRIYIEATGQQNVPDGGFVYASNHESLVDIAKAYLKEKYDKPGNVYVGVVSRLDAYVTGVVVLALQGNPIVGGVLLAAGGTDLAGALFLSRGG